MSTVFAKIIAGDIPAEFLHEDEHCVVIRDAQPQAPVHLLVIPRKPVARLAEASPEDQALLGHLLLVASQVAHAHGTGDAFRTVINSGAGVGQTVFHLHVHVLGGYRATEDSLNS